MKTGTSLALALVVLAPAAEAGVRGNTYLGDLACANGSETVSSCMSFEPNGHFELVTDFGSGPGSLEGTFSELDLFFVSFWEVSHYGVGSTRGVSLLFGLFSTVSLRTIVVSCDGFYSLGACGAAADAPTDGEVRPGASVLATFVPDDPWAGVRRSPAVR